MTIPFALPHASTGRRQAGAQSAAARVAIAHALLAGVAGDLLLRGGHAGLAFPVCISLVVAAVVSLTWRLGRTVPPEARAWLGVAVLFAAMFAWREADELHFLDVVTTIAALVMAGVALGVPTAALFAARLRDTIWSGAVVVLSTIVGALTLVVPALTVRHDRPHTGPRAAPIARAALLGVVLLLVFGSLLLNADPIFASLVALPELDLGTLVSHVMLIGFFTWIAAGWASAALLGNAARLPAPEGQPLTLQTLDVGVALGTLNVLFALFVASQLGWFFGGEAFLQARTGLTAAQYARQGFFEMVVVVALVIPLLLTTRALLAPDRALARLHTRLSLPIIALLGAIILSASLRMRLYVHYYGLTTDRFYPLVFMGWLAVMLVWLAITVLRDRGRVFAAGAALSGLCVLVGLNVVAPDALVAHVNVARAEAQPVSAGAPTLDVAHLATLSGDAADVAVRSALAPALGAPGSALRVADQRQRCVAAARLLRRWGTGSVAAQRAAEDGAWQSWNAGERNALRLVAQNARALGVIGAPCAKARGTSAITVND